MHSSRMRTAHLLAVSPSMHCTGGMSNPGGCLLLGVCALLGGLLGGWCLLLGGLFLGGGLLISAIPTCTEADPPVNRMTDRQVLKHNLCKLRLRAVKNDIFMMIGECNFFFGN